MMPFSMAANGRWRMSRGRKAPLDSRVRPSAGVGRGSRPSSTAGTCKQGISAGRRGSKAFALGRLRQ